MDKFLNEVPHKVNFAELGFMYVWLNSNFIFRDPKVKASKEHPRVCKVPIIGYEVLSYSVGIVSG